MEHEQTVADVEGALETLDAESVEILEGIRGML